MIEPSGQPSEDSPFVANVALAVGLAVIVVTGASQVGLGPADFLTVTEFGLAGAAFSAYAVKKSRRLRSWIGLLLSILPIALLVYFLAKSDG